MIGVIGLGRMRDNILRRLTRNGHQCVVFHYTTETTTLRSMHKIHGLCCSSHITPFREAQSFNL